MSIVLLTKGLLLCVISLAAWPTLSRLIYGSPLDALPGPPSRSWLFGNVFKIFSPKAWDFHCSILKHYGRVIKLRGALGEPVLVTCDPKALHHILIKDPYIYEVAQAVVIRRRLVFGDGLLTTSGEIHRKHRRMLNPVFSSNKIRELTPLFYDVAERVRMRLEKKLVNGTQEIDILHWVARAALELIGRGGLDYSFDTLLDDDNIHPYSAAVKRFTGVVGGFVGFFASQYIFPYTEKFKFPRLKRLIVEHIPIKRVQEVREVVDTIYQTAVQIVDVKKAMVDADPEVAAEMTNKKDIISILLRANASASEEDRLTDEEVVSQVSTFVFAGVDTTSSAVVRTLQLLTMHGDIQQRLREEVQGAKKSSNGQMSYDQLMSLPYLDAICRETLRVYPPNNFAPVRTPTRDMILPLSKPVLDSTGKKLSELHIPKGTNIIISVVGTNCSPDLWGPDSYEWKPERWLSPLPKAVEDAHVPGVYSHLLTFSGGGRACIGFMFAQLEMKVLLSVLLSSFKFSRSEKEIVWKVNNMAGPIVPDEDPKHQQLPIVMSLVD